MDRFEALSEVGAGEAQAVEAPAPGEAASDEPTPAGTAKLCNWRQFHDQLRDAAIVSFRTGKPLALLLAEVRDPGRAGEPLDQALIRSFAAHMGPGGAVVRYGRETLIAILPDTDAQAATAVADAFRRAVLTCPEAGDADPIELLSVAISGYDPDEPLSHLLKRGFDRLRLAASQGAGATPSG